MKVDDFQHHDHESDDDNDEDDDDIEFPGAMNLTKKTTQTNKNKNKKKKKLKINVDDNLELPGAVFSRFRGKVSQPHPVFWIDNSNSIHFKLFKRQMQIF